MLTKEAVEIIPLAMAGGTDPERVFDGKDAVLDYLQSILDNFKQAVLVDRQAFITDDGATMFAEGRGDLIMKQTGQPYRNRLKALAAVPGSTRPNGSAIERNASASKLLSQV